LKIGIVGCGYWGKILLKNLVQLGYKNITICETGTVDWSQLGAKYNLVRAHKNLDCDVAFVATPPGSHFEVCRSLLRRGIDVFCEKPLTLTHKSSLALYKEAQKTNSRLFVDWIFIYNPCVRVVSEIIKRRGKPKSIIANRFNYGPVRTDVNARWDLASHDVSIARFLLGEYPEKINWMDFKRSRQSRQQDSTVGILSFQDTSVQINASWEYGKKERMYSFEFEDGFVYWDDNDKTVIDGFEHLDVPDYSPLHESINCFIEEKFEQAEQKSLTLDTIRIIENESDV
jgi:predicted dehydrogenase